MTCQSRYPRNPALDGLAVTNQQLKNINQILRENIETSDDAYLWLVDTYENLPNFNGAYFIKGTQAAVDASWQSPFATRSLSEIATWVRGIPKPSKAICKRYFAVVQKNLYEQHGQVLMCKIIKGQGEPQTIPINASKLAIWVTGYHRDEWRDDWEDQRPLYQ